MFKWVWSWAFILLPLPLLLLAILPRAKTQLGAALKVPFLDYFSETDIRKRAHFFSKDLWWPFLIWIFLLLSLAGPEWVGLPIQIDNQGRSIMLAVDVSGSMETPDMNYYGRSLTRLSLVKAIAGEFIKNRTSDQLGLILFGSQAYLQTPLTRDREIVVDMLDTAVVGLAGTQTAIGDGIGLAIKQLVKYPKASRVLVLLTDGQNNMGSVSPLEAAEMAKKADVKIYTIGLGASQIMVNTPFGPQYMPSNSDLDEGELKKIAKITGGEYFRAKNGEDLQRVYDSINQLEPVKTDQATFRPIKELYPWPLGIALLLSVMWVFLQKRQFA